MVCYRKWEGICSTTGEDAQLQNLFDLDFQLTFVNPAAKSSGTEIPKAPSQLF